MLLPFLPFVFTTLAGTPAATVFAPIQTSFPMIIGGGETDAMRLIARTVQKLKVEYPHIHYHLFSGNGDDVTERLDKGLLDFGILIDPADMKKYDHLKLPATDIWGLLMPKDSPLASKAAKIFLSKLQEEIEYGV